jgi:hypothetical protein
MLRIVEAPPWLPMKEPKIKLRSSVPVSDRFRAEMDAWLLETFGERHFCYFLGDFGAVVMAVRDIGWQR